MKWENLNSESQIEVIKNESFKNTQIIFKHSTRCAISSMAYNRLKKDDGNETQKIYYLDLLNYRMASNQIAEVFQIEHQSPQILIIKAGICIYESSHQEISVEAIYEKIK